jgi:hypothetical protein
VAPRRRQSSRERLTLRHDPETVGEKGWGHRVEESPPDGDRGETCGGDQQEGRVEEPGALCGAKAGVEVTLRGGSPREDCVGESLDLPAHATGIETSVAELFLRLRQRRGRQLVEQLRKRAHEPSGISIGLLLSHVLPYV